MISVAVTAASFIVMIYFIIRPRVIRLPLLGYRVRLDYMMGSVIGALLLIILSVLTPQQALSSLIGREGFSPYTIIILFMAVAYIAISLDSTGFFEYLALKIILRTGGDGRRLFFSFYFLSGFITLFTSNDIVILTLTPIIFYFGKHAKINVLPYLVAEFFAANVWSMGFYFSNPTNIIAASASGITLLSFSTWMIIPTIVGGLLCLTILYIIFRGDVNVKFKVPGEIDPDEFLPDKACAFITCAVFMATIFTLAISPLIGLEMWTISLVAAMGLFCYDAAVAMVEHSNKNLSFYRIFKRYAYRGHAKVYSFRLHLIAERMPWRIMPFLICAFIMVEGLVVSGVTDGIASFLSAVSVNVFASALSMGLLSSFSANLINNQPMTVLFTKITESQHFLLTGNDRLASVYALIAGSNLGANITLIGALAGIMWANILRQKDKRISYKNFAKLGLVVTVPVIIATCMTLALELFLFGG